MLNRFSTLDLETVEYKGNQVPIAISLSMVSPDKSTKEHFFIIDHSKLVYLEGTVTQESLDMVIDQMWIEFINFIKMNCKNQSLKVLFVHNLGSFDGIFIFKYLTRLAKNASFETLIDGSNDFIKITVTLSKGVYKINFIDSCRIFPIGLDKLCKTYGVEGKTQKYDISKFNNFNLFKDLDLLTLFKEYSIQDSKALAEALLVAQSNIFLDYSIDITDCLSASNLAALN